MAYQLYFLYLVSFLISLQADWVEIAQKSTTPPTSKPKSSIRVLKKSEFESLYNEQTTTPSPQWIAYQKERFSQRQNTDSHKLVVTAGNQMKNSAKVIVPANNSKRNSTMRSKNKIIKTTTRVDVINNKSEEELVELPHLEPQTTTRRDMNHDNADDYEYVESSDDNENAEHTEMPQEDDNETGLEYPSWRNFLKFVRRVQDYWVKHAGLTINQKINYLKGLRDRLMLKIEEQFDLIFPSKDRPQRNTRSLFGESKINFPPEITLMSMNFLTFAVFLIKLALLVVRLLKSKHYKISGLGLSTQPFVQPSLRN